MLQVSFTGEGDAQPSTRGVDMVRQLQAVQGHMDERLADARVQLFGRGQSLSALEAATPASQNDGVTEEGKEESDEASVSDGEADSEAGKQCCL